MHWNTLDIHLGGSGSVILHLICVVKDGNGLSFTLAEEKMIASAYKLQCSSVNFHGS